MVYVKKKKPGQDVEQIARRMVLLKVKGTRLVTVHVGDRVEIQMVWEDHEMEKEHNKLQEKLNDITKRKAD